MCLLGLMKSRESRLCGSRWKGPLVPGAVSRLTLTPSEWIHCHLFILVLNQGLQAALLLLLRKRGSGAEVTSLVTPHHGRSLRLTCSLMRGLPPWGHLALLLRAQGTRPAWLLLERVVKPALLSSTFLNFPLRLPSCLLLGAPLILAPRSLPVHFCFQCNVPPQALPPPLPPRLHQPTPSRLSAHGVRTAAMPCRSEWT